MKLQFKEIESRPHFNQAYSLIRVLAKREKVSIPSQAIAWRQFKKALDNSYIMVAAFMNNKIIGTVSVHLNYDPVTPYPWGYIMDVIVDEKFRGKGIGKKLLDAGIKQSTKRGCKSFQIAVANDNNAALKLYQAVGFKKEDSILLNKKVKKD